MDMKNNLLSIFLQIRCIFPNSEHHTGVKNTNGYVHALMAFLMFQQD